MTFKTHIALVGALVITFGLNACTQWTLRPVTKYYGSGSKESEGLVYEDGPSALPSREGEWAAWYESGARRWQGQFVASRREGAWVYWHSNGVIAAKGVYKRNLFDGTWTFWSEMGTEVARGEFSSGSGRYIERDEAGNKVMEGQYQCNMRDGKWTMWYPNGQKRAEGQCLSGAPDGEWKFWSEEGKFARREMFDYKRASDFGKQAARIAE